MFFLNSVAEQQEISIFAICPMENLFRLPLPAIGYDMTSDQDGHRRNQEDPDADHAADRNGFEGIND